MKEGLAGLVFLKMGDINSIILPLLGTREGDYTSFQYLPLQIEKDQVKFSIPDWVLKRDTLNQDDIINLHLGLYIDERRSSHVEILERYTDSEQESEIYLARIIFEYEPADSYVYISPHSSRIEFDRSLEKTESGILRQSIKDCWMLKKGVAIYLGHLAAYFSRISQFSKEDYSILKETLLIEPLDRINKNIVYLGNLYDEVKSEENSGETIVMTFDPESFGSTLLSELELDIFKLSLDSDLAISYIKTIKDLERRLFTNHNIISSLYARELESLQET